MFRLLLDEGDGDGSPFEGAAASDFKIDPNPDADPKVDKREPVKDDKDSQDDDTRFKSTAPTGGEGGVKPTALPDQSAGSEPVTKPDDDVLTPLREELEETKQQLRSLLAEQDMAKRRAAQEQLDRIRAEEDNLINYVVRLETDAEFAQAELDRVGPIKLNSYQARAYAIAEQRKANAALQSAENAAAEARYQEQLKTTTKSAYAYGYSKGLNKSQIETVFQENEGFAWVQGGMDRLLEVFKDKVDRYVNSKGGKVPPEAQSLVTADEQARRELAQSKGSGGGGANQPSESDKFERFVTNMQKAGEEENPFE